MLSIDWSIFWYRPDWEILIEIGLYLYAVDSNSHIYSLELASKRRENS